MGYTHGIKWTIELIKDWCKLNNKSLKLLSDKYEGMNKKLIWKCLKEECGEIFEASWNNIYANHGCPYCCHNPQKVNLSNCLATKNPQLTSEWHLIKNGKLTPYDITVNSGKKVWWQCKENPEHEWQATISNRNYGNNCPYCSGRHATNDNNLLVINPKLCEEWDYEKNNLTPDKYMPNSNVKVWWRCSKNPKHVWLASIFNRMKGKKCPYCCNKKIGYDNCLEVLRPDLAPQWHINLNGNLTPEMVGVNSNKKVWWICDKNNNHIWMSSIINRTKGKGCPYCSGRYPTEESNLLVINPKLCEEWDFNKNKKRPEEYLPYLNKKVWWVCSECGYKYKSLISGRSYGIGCPECAESHMEVKIREWLKTNSVEYIAQKTFENLIGLGDGLLSYDFYLPNYCLLIEAQGQFHDGNGSKGNYYVKQNLEKQQEHDRRKREYAKQQNIYLLEIWYYDFEKIEEILQVALNNLPNKASIN